MKKALIAMVMMTLFLTLGGGLISRMLSFFLGGGVEQSYIYPLYGGIILLTGVVVGAAQLILAEMEKIELLLENHNKKIN